MRKIVNKITIKNLGKNDNPIKFQALLESLATTHHFPNNRKSQKYNACVKQRIPCLTDTTVRCCDMNENAPSKINCYLLHKCR